MQSCRFLHAFFMVDYSLSVQGYNAKDRKGALFEDWDLPESATTGQSEVSFIVYLFSHEYMTSYLLAINRISVAKCDCCLFMV